MAVALITIHAYRSWTEDNPRGYVQRGEPGIQQPNERLANHRALIAKHPPVQFDHEQKRLLIEATLAICKSLDVRLHAASATSTHMHVLVSWVMRDVTVRSVSTALKRKLGSRLSRMKGSQGNRWFGRGVDETIVRDRKHFDHLYTKYLPDHVQQGGMFWCDAMSTA